MPRCKLLANWILCSYLGVMKVAESLLSWGDPLGIFMKIRKKATMCARYPRSTIGSRPYLLVLFPIKPKAAPPNHFMSKNTFLVKYTQYICSIIPLSIWTFYFLSVFFKSFYQVLASTAYLEFPPLQWTFQIYQWDPWHCPQTVVC